MTVDSQQMCIQMFQEMVHRCAIRWINCRWQCKWSRSLRLDHIRQKVRSNDSVVWMVRVLAQIVRGTDLSPVWSTLFHLHHSCFKEIFIFYVLHRFASLILTYVYVILHIYVIVSTFLLPILCSNWKHILKKSLHMQE